MAGINNDLEGLSRNISKTIEENGHRMSLPKIKLVQVSPKLSLKNFRNQQL
jgi:hypothetical protein